MELYSFHINVCEINIRTLHAYFSHSKSWNTAHDRFSIGCNTFIQVRPAVCDVEHVVVTKGTASAGKFCNLHAQ